MAVFRVVVEDAGWNGDHPGPVHHATTEGAVVVLGQRPVPGHGEVGALGGVDLEPGGRQSGGQEVPFRPIARPEIVVEGRRGV